MMDDSINADNLKREPRWSTWEEEASIVSSEPSVTWGTDGIATPVATETSQGETGQSRVANAASIPAGEGLLESMAGSASVTPVSFTTTTTGIPTTSTPTSSISAMSETTTPTITTSTETPMTLSGTVSSTTTNILQTTAPGTYSGGGDSVKNKLAIALPIAIVGLLIILAVLFFFIRRRKRRNARQPYEMSGTEAPGVSTAALMSTTRKVSIASPEPAAMNLSRLPVIDVTRTHDHETTPGSASARSEEDRRTELGIAMPVPVNQRLSATERDLRDFSRPVSSASRRVSNGPPSAGLASVRMPFESRSEDDDGVSTISGEIERTDHGHDFDDMSSVSSFDEHEREGHGQSLR